VLGDVCTPGAHLLQRAAESSATNWIRSVRRGALAQGAVRLVECLRRCHWASVLDCQWSGLHRLGQGCVPWMWRSPARFCSGSEPGAAASTRVGDIDEQVVPGSDPDCWHSLKTGFRHGPQDVALSIKRNEHRTFAMSYRRRVIVFSLFGSASPSTNCIAAESRETVPRSACRKRPMNRRVNTPKDLSFLVGLDSS
jgi:hypothetical protein